MNWPKEPRVKMTAIYSGGATAEIECDTHQECYIALMDGDHTLYFVNRGSYKTEKQYKARVKQLAARCKSA